MTKKQAVDINETFRKNLDSINYYKSEAIQDLSFSYKLSEFLNNERRITDSLKVLNDSIIEHNLLIQDSCVAQTKSLRRDRVLSTVRESFIITSWTTVLIWFITNW
jgi:hypothetical protein